MKNDISGNRNLPSMQSKDFVTFHIEGITKEDTRQCSRLKFQAMNRRSRYKT